MKKIVTLFVALAMLSGCAKVTSSDEVVSKTTEITVSESNSQQDQQLLPTFRTTEEVLTVLDGRLAKNDYPSLSDAAHSLVLSNIDNVNYNCELYMPIQGVNIYAISNAENNALFQFVFEVEKGANNVFTAQYIGYIETTLPFLFEPKDWKDLSEKLEMMPDVSSADQTATIGSTQYSYRRTSDEIYFSAISENWAEVDVKRIDWKNGTVTLPKIDISSIEFFDQLKSALAKTDSYYDNVTQSELDIEALEEKDPNIAKVEGCSFGPGIVMYTSSSASGRLESVEFIIVFKDATSESTKRYANIFITAIQILEPNQLDSIFTTLDLTNITGETTRSAIGSKMNYFYSTSNSDVYASIGRMAPLAFIDDGQEKLPVASNPEKTPSVSASTPSEQKTSAQKNAAASSAVSNSSAASESYTNGSPRFEGWLCESVDTVSDIYNVKPVNPKTTFASGETIWLAGRFYGWTGEENLTFKYEFPDGTVDESPRYHRVAGNQESMGHPQECMTAGKGSLTITMNRTGQTLAVLPFEITN